MFDLGWSELLVIAVVAIIFVGPRELVPMLRSFGRFAAKMKSMASEFQSQFNDALREAELDQVKNQVEKAGNLKPMNALRKQLEDMPRSVEGAISGKKKAGDAAPAAKPASAGKPAAKKPAAKKSAANKSVAKKSAPKKAAANKQPARKPAAKKTATGKSVPRKTASARPAKQPARGAGT